ncbi:ABC transporter ATP-binding protein [Methylobacter sp. BBA5.1]|uniref:ABC transporter ATP-binding protein n=1 Tax=Methylobacter sp. BBA5.1 TaxID=1495064 RepID=UPI00055BF8FF|nr:ABC transporter ATP-binding protein [Methylobacter sp. BBA5.1]
MTQKDVLISVQNVTVSYPIKRGYLKWSKYTPLKNISFDLHRGETLGIIGRNGAGKSTLLRMIAGIIEPDSGQIINHGARVSLLALGVGFMPHLTGRENAMLSGMLLGMRRREILKRMDAIIEFSGLGDFIDQPLRTYSSGMSARLGFSVSIQATPDALLIDEVLGVGDEDFRKKSTEEMKRLIRSDTAIVLVSHSIPVVKELCDRAILIDQGIIRMTGLTNDVLDQYQNSKQ